MRTFCFAGCTSVIRMCAYVRLSTLPAQRNQGSRTADSKNKNKDLNEECRGVTVAAMNKVSVSDVLLLFIAAE